MRYLVVIAFLLIAHGGAAQHQRRLTLIPPKNEQSRSFTKACLCNEHTDEFLPNFPEADTIKHLEGRLSVYPAIKFAGECNGIFYWILRTEYWPVPTFRGPNGAFHEHRYLVIIGDKFTVFKPYDAANTRKFNRIRKDLIQLIGVAKTDSIKPQLIRGNRQF